MNDKRMQEMLANLDVENPSEVCPIKDVLATMLDKWTMMIVLVLGKHKVLRFADVKRSVVGISPKMLTKSLRTLERDGHVKRTVYPEVPIRVEYNLTDQGSIFLKKLVDLADWIVPHVPAIVKNREEFIK
ncbi:helix-turn-helix transcriptional regulator [Polaribacter sp. Z014]|uniref:winged helix-turn-helix transcriptional regulator n=1 Tax=Flavobacteriaceae TaxID=49546 RepID=UPI000E471A18|nr:MULTISPECIES: helix-turn-helix domain-containing protein [Flavobacteriaceae]MCL7765442.1 helix-turn-helix transcriptional regulator [Polaribacter sp. Z014]